MARCLVTGHEGYIGSHLYQKLQQLGHEVMGIDLMSIKQMGDVRSNKFLKSSKWRSFKPEFIFHLAAKPSVQWSVENPSQSLSHNVHGTSCVLEFAKEVSARRVIFSSSAAVYGDDSSPSNPYGLHKLMSEMECKLYAELYDLDTVSLRYFNVFSKDKKYGGPYSTVIAAWNYASRNNKPFVVYGDGRQTRDFVHVEDVVDCNIFCMNHKDKFKGMALDVGTGLSTSLNQLKDAISAIQDCEWFYKEARTGDIKDSRANTTSLKNMGWYPTIEIMNSIKQIFGG